MGAIGTSLTMLRSIEDVGTLCERCVDRRRLGRENNREIMNDSTQFGDTTQWRR